MSLVVAIPSLTIVEAWNLPWDYAMDLCDALARRSARAAKVTSGGGGDGGEPVKRRPMRNGQGHHGAGVTKLASLFGI